MKRLIVILILLVASTVHAQDISKDTLTKRLTELEKTKVQIEQAYTELIARINELKYLLEDKKDEQVYPSEGADKPDGK